MSFRVPAVNQNHPTEIQKIEKNHQKIEKIEKKNIVENIFDDFFIFFDLGWVVLVDCRDSETHF